MNPVLVEVLRGTLVESRHRGALCVMDADGRSVFERGDVDRPVFPRSAVKALQALPLVEDGAASRYSLTAAEIALACASHSGEPEHVAVAAGMLAKAGRDQSCLECGAHWPMGEAASRALASAGGEKSALHNNCSGKHAGFICLSCDAGDDPTGYVRPDHPVQRRIRDALIETTGDPHDEDRRGVDGCSIPTYAVPLRALAHAFARFGTGQGYGPRRAGAARLIREAVAQAPFMVAGTGRFDTRLMTALGARAFVKTGAEGVYCGALPELGLGVAVKSDDGAGRSAEVIMASVIRRLLPLEGEAADLVSTLASPVLKNWNGIEVGRLRASDAL
jgi:L-asparaginase II